MKNLHFIAPTILPLITGCNFEEGLLDSESITVSYEDLHPIYEYWMHLRLNTHMVEEGYLNITAKCSTSSRVETVSYSEDLQINILMRCTRQKRHVTSVSE